MIWTNYHTHCRYCDGSDDPEKYVLSAIENGLSVYGFSSHAPLPYPITIMHPDDLQRYANEVKQLKAKYAGDIEILLSLEIDYMPGVMGPNDAKYQELNLDYTVGSVHYVDFFEDGLPFGIDGSTTLFEKGLNTLFDGNAEKLYRRYFEITRQMIRENCPDILGHIDKMKVYNKGERYFSFDAVWYRDELLAALDVIRQTQVVVELNTRGVYTGKTTEFYPSNWVLERLCELDIPVMINSDGHKPQEVKSCFDEALTLLSKIGFKSLRILKNGAWTDLEL
jgi:histidinol-phosphatase (PHP family)